MPKYRTPTLGEELGNFVRPLIQEHGKIKSYNRTQFSIVTTTSKQELYKYEGVLIFEDGYQRPYFITTSTNIENVYISGYQLDI